MITGLSPTHNRKLSRLGDMDDSFRLSPLISQEEVVINLPPLKLV